MREGWTSTTVGRLLSLEYGKALKEENRTGGGFPVLSSAGVIGRHRESLTGSGPAVVVGRKGTAGSVHWSDGPCWPIDTAFWVRLESDHVDLRFAYLLLEHLDLPSICAQTGVPGLNRDRAYALTVLLPSLAEQRRIVDLVTSLDHYQRGCRRLSDGADTTREAMFSERFAAADATWPRTALGEVVEVAMGRQRSPEHATGDHLVPYLRAANVKDGRLVLDDVLTMNFSPVEQEKFALVRGDVLVTEGCGSLRQLGASASWQDDLPGTTCFQNTLLRLRARPGVTLPDFVELWARHAHRSGLWADIASGTNIFHVGSTRAAKAPVVLPPLTEQQRIVDLAGAMDAIDRASANAADAAALLREQLLVALLTGEHEIPETYDEFLAEG